MTNTIYRELVCRAIGGIYRLRGGTPWRYDGKASCMSKQTHNPLTQNFIKRRVDLAFQIDYKSAGISHAWGDLTS